LSELIGMQEGPGLQPVFEGLLLNLTQEVECLSLFRLQGGQAGLGIGPEGLEFQMASIERSLQGSQFLEELAMEGLKPLFLLCGKAGPCNRTSPFPRWRETLSNGRCGRNDQGNRQS